MDCWVIRERIKLSVCLPISHERMVVVTLNQTTGHLQNTEFISRGTHLSTTQNFKNSKFDLK